MKNPNNLNFLLHTKHAYGIDKIRQGQFEYDKTALYLNGFVKVRSNVYDPEIHGDCSKLVYVENEVMTEEQFNKSFKNVTWIDS